MGKDRPGSPISADATVSTERHRLGVQLPRAAGFPAAGTPAAVERQLHVEDGWRYFIHGWTQVIAEVFDIDMPRRTVDELGHVAASLR